MGKKISLTENDLKQMVNETVKKLVMEFYGTFDDTTSAPWNQGNDPEPYKNSGVIKDYLIDLEPLMNEHPELRKFLKSLSNNGDFSECNVGDVKVEWEEYPEYDDPIYGSEGPEVLDDTYSLSLADSNRLKQSLPDKLVEMLEAIIQDDFEKNGSHDWIEN